MTTHKAGKKKKRCVNCGTLGIAEVVVQEESEMAAWTCPYCETTQEPEQ